MFGSEAFGIFAVYYSLFKFYRRPVLLSAGAGSSHRGQRGRSRSCEHGRHLLVIGVSLAVAVLFSFTGRAAILALCLKANDLGVDASSIFFIGMTQIMVQRCRGAVAACEPWRFARW